MTKRERLREYNRYLLNILRLYKSDNGSVGILLRKIQTNRKINSIRLEAKLKNLSLPIQMLIFPSLTTFDNFMIEQPKESKMMPVDNPKEKESFQRWLGFKGKWKEPKEKQPRKPRTWKLPEFDLPLGFVYLAENTVTHRYTDSRVAKGMSKLAKAGVMAGALVVYVSDKEWKGTKLRKIVRYNNTFVPRMLSDVEKERVYIDRKHASGGELIRI